MAAVYLVYSALVAAVLIVGSPFWIVQMLRLGKYRAGLRERFGMVPYRLRRSSQKSAIWVHAVSVGEVLAVSGLVGELRAAFPNHRVVVSTTTHTGQRLARERFGEESVFYFPLDLVTVIRPYFDVLRPKLVVLAETEFWPNFLHVAHGSGAKVAVVNARISDRSLPRYLRLRSLLKTVLADVDLFLAQSNEDARRLREIGADAGRVHVSGNLKFDVRPPAYMPIVDTLRENFARNNAAPILIAGSTVEDEEAMLMEAFRVVLERHTNAVLLLAPRHKERFEAVAGLLRESGLTWWRRSEFDASEQVAGGVLLLDTIGELASLYELSGIALVGGSLVPRGGHNILEPALHGAAILVGPHTENFRDIINLFARGNALRVVSPETIAGTWLELIENDTVRRELGTRAREVMQEQMGGTSRTMAGLRELLSAQPASASQVGPAVRR